MNANDYSDVAVLLPAHNEAAVIGRTVRYFRAVLPGAQIVVCDIASIDGTARKARRAGAVVQAESRGEKGHALCRMLSTIEAEIFVLWDASIGYNVPTAAKMVELLRSRRLDMVTGVRRSVGQAPPAAALHGLNRLFCGLLGEQVGDAFSAVRVISRRLAKSFPVRSAGFSIGAELTAMACAMSLPCAEMDLAYRDRRSGVWQVVGRWHESWRMVRGLCQLGPHYRPLPFFGAMAGLVMAVGIAVGMCATQLPAGAVLVVMALAVLCGLTGVVLDGIARLRLEGRQLAYLRLGGASAPVVVGYEVRSAAGAGEASYRTALLHAVDAPPQPTYG